MVWESSDPSRGWRRAFWLGFLVAASVAFSFAFACATPFAAFAAAAAFTLPRRDAITLSMGVWLAVSRRRSRHEYSQSMPSPWSVWSRCIEWASPSGSRRPTASLVPSRVGLSEVFRQPRA